MLDTSKHILLELLHKSLDKDYKVKVSLFKNINWVEVADLATTQSVISVCFDAFEELTQQCRPDLDNLMEWLGQTSYIESYYDEHLKSIKNLSSFFRRQEIKPVLMKGYGMSLNYPVPNHRPTGDIDLYHCGLGEFADQIAREKLGIEVKQNEEKHSTYDFEGVHVENHATIICELEHKTLAKVERFLENDLIKNSIYDEVSGCFLPSDMFNAVYLPLHLGNHLVYEGANLRQVVDYALMVKNATKIDWNVVREFAIDGGYFKFLCCLNGICMDYLGIPATCFPAWERNKTLENKVLNEILSPDKVETSTIVGKVRRYFSNKWKFNLVYSKESHLGGFFLRFRSWLIWKWGIGRKSVWDK